MSLTQYKNIDQILSAKNSLSADRIDKTQLQNITTNLLDPVTFNNNIVNNSTVEFHIYSGETWITGQHKNQSLEQTPTFYNSVTKKEIRFDSQPYVLDINQQTEQLKLNGGTYRIVVNFFENLIGGY